MPTFLEQPPYNPKGPDGQGWNRLSLNAHGGLWNECGLMPTNHPTLFEAMTGRQRWGGFDPCTGRGACGKCPVQQRYLTGEGGLEWPEGVPLLLARVRPWPSPPGALFGGLTAGRSNLELHAWNGGPPLLETNWIGVLNAARRGARKGLAGATVSWFWVDQESEAFWVVRFHPAGEEALVRTEVGPAATRHELYAREGGPRLAVLTCQGACAHEAYHLRHLAADLGDRTAAADRSTPPPSLPERLPGVPLITLSHGDKGTVLHRPRSRDYDTSTVRLDWDVPFDDLTVTALVAHAVRLTTAT